MIEPSAAAKRAMASENSGEVWIDLVTFTHPDLDPPIRLTNDKTEIIGFEDGVPLPGTRSRAAGRVGPDAADPVHVFNYVPFAIAWPGYEEGAVPEIPLKIDMIDRAKILPLLRTRYEGRVKCLVESVLASAPDVVNFRFAGFYLVAAPWNDVSAELKLQLARYDLEPYPVGVLTPAIAPGLFP